MENRECSALYDKDNVVAGLAEINAFCKVISQTDMEVSNELVKRWEQYTNEAIKLLNEID
jgi:hypothetical protein